MPLCSVDVGVDVLILPFQNSGVGAVSFHVGLDVVNVGKLGLPFVCNFGAL